MSKSPDAPRNPAKMVTLQLRFREETRARVEEAAKAAGTSMNSEVIHRLERSLDEDGLLGDRHTRSLLTEIAIQIGRAEAGSGCSWHEDLATFYAAQQLIRDALRRAAPMADNHEAVVTAEALIATLSDKRDVLARLLQKSGALGHGNALARMLSDNPFDQSLQRLPREGWQFPDEEGRPLTENEIGFIEKWLSEYEAIEKEIAEAQERRDEANKPLVDAASRGRGLYVHLTRQREE